MGELLGILAGIIGYDVAVADKPPLINQQAFQPDRSPGMNLVGADPHFRAQAETEPVGKPAACIDKHAGGIHIVHELDASLIA